MDKHNALATCTDPITTRTRRVFLAARAQGTHVIGFFAASVRQGTWTLLPSIEPDERGVRTGFPPDVHDRKNTKAQQLSAIAPQQSRGSPDAKVCRQDEVQDQVRRAR